jgi:hypothetical protein
MPVTALIVPTPDGEVKSKVVTTATDHGLLVELFKCDDQWEHVGQSEKFGEVTPEEDYHKSLRINAAMAGHFVPEQSTNPELNPEYKEPTGETLENIPAKSIVITEDDFRLKNMDEEFYWDGVTLVKVGEGLHEDKENLFEKFENTLFLRVSSPRENYGEG